MIRFRRHFERNCLLLAVSALAMTSCTKRMVLEEGNGSASVSPSVSAPARSSLRVWLVKSRSGELSLVDVSRPRGMGDPVKTAVQELLNGPTEQEMKAGIGSEIPRGTVLIDVSQDGDKIELNLSRRFAAGGGVSSFETRLEQLRKTVLGLSGSKKIFLDVEGKRLTTAVGEGLEVKQPIN